MAYLPLSFYPDPTLLTTPLLPERCNEPIVIFIVPAIPAPTPDPRTRMAEPGEDARHPIPFRVMANSVHDLANRPFLFLLRTALKYAFER